MWFDHAAPFFSVTTDEFKKGLVTSWQSKGLVEQWRPRLGTDGVHVFVESQLWVGTPSNHAVCKSLSDQLLHLGGVALFGRHANNATFKDQQWHLRTTNRLESDAEELYRFDALVLTDKLLVLPNRYAVLEPEDVQALAVPEVLQSTGQVALLLVFDPPLDIQADLIRPSSGSLDLLVRDSSKPGRSFNADVWTARSSSSYAAQHLRGEALDDEAAVLNELLNEFHMAAGSAQKPVVASIFAWDHAQPLEQLADKAFSLDATRRLGLCGDFFQPGQKPFANGVEAASLSGLFLSKALLPLMSAL